jgi:hypothetical protein
VSESTDYLSLDDDRLLQQCDIHIYKSSGPGGQHRNKVSSAVRLRHRPTGVSAHGDDSRSQQDNKRMAVKRLRMNLACQLRRPVQRDAAGSILIPPTVRECMFVPRGRGANPAVRLEIGGRDFRFWGVAAWLLDVLDAMEGRMSDAAAQIGITTGNLSDLLGQDRHLLATAQEIRKKFGLKPLN